MKILVQLVLSLWLSENVFCGVFNDHNTVKKARCYANCLTLTSEIPLKDVNCQSNECVQCKSPCDVIFSNFTACNQTCNPSSKLCEKSCRFLDKLSKKVNIYDGSEGISKPGIPMASTKNTSSLNLKWQPSIATNGSAVYLLKIAYRGDFNTGPFPIKNIVYLNATATLTASEACAFKSSWRQTYNGMSFVFTIVALTENSSLVTSQDSSSIVFDRIDTVESIYNPLVYYEEKVGDDLHLQVSIKPPPALIGKNVNYQLITKSVSETPQIGVAREKSVTTDKPTNVSFQIFQKLKATNISITAYSMESCLPSKPKELIYEYRGCHNISSYNRTLCCTFDPDIANSPVKTREVRNLTYTPFKITNDFLFNTRISWREPSHSCPDADKYSIQYGDKNNYLVFGKVKIWKSKNDQIKEKYFDVAGIKPGIEYKFKIIPVFGEHFNIGQSSYLFFNTSEVPQKEASVSSISFTVAPFSLSTFFVVNFTWPRPSFNYSAIQSYNFSYTLQGRFEGHNITKSHNFAVVGLDFGQLLTYQVTPIYNVSWIKANPTTGAPIKKEPDSESLLLTDVKANSFEENRITNLYSVTFTWIAPTFVKPVEYYKVRYTLKGYLGNELDCPTNGSHTRDCITSKTSKTSFTITNALPKERIEFLVKPVFLNTRFVKTTEIKAQVIRAPDPRSSIVQVRSLNYTEYNYQYTISWEKPLFNHSKVLHYDVLYETFKANVVARKRRSIAKTTNVTETYYVTPEVENGMQAIVKITPQFEDKLISGETSELRLAGPGSTGAQKAPSKFSEGETAALVIGILLLVAFILIIILLLLRSAKKKAIREGRVADSNKGAVIDQWEVFHDKLLLDDVIGQGAFGKVYKGTLAQLPEQSSKYTSNMSFRRKSTLRRPIEEDNGYTVAVKMLQDMADDEQRKEFLKEIQLMKDVGSHRNIVNMLGCGTLSDPMFLIVEYLPNGDLLHYLRKRRGNAHQYADSDPRGPYHSTYCQTYFNKNKPALASPVQESNKTQTSDSPIYTYFNKLVNRGFQNDDPGNIQLVAIQTGSNPEISNEDETSYDDEDDTITSGDIMAFAWQVSQGMEFLARRGYVHRDLAARNVLVGENKEAKIADFGLTRHMYNSLYTAKANRRLPIKWMSIEAIFDQTFTEKSDVWAYGVLLWELVTLGGTPYPTKSIRELLKALKDGYRMEKPETCDTEVYKMMLQCWEEKPEERPTFEKIRTKLEEMMMRDNPYFDPSSVDESRDYYNVPSFNSIEDDSDGVDDEDFDAIFGNLKENIDKNGSINGICLEDVKYSGEYDNERKDMESNQNIVDVESLLNRKQFNSSPFSS